MANNRIYFSTSSFYSRFTQEILRLNFESHLVTSLQELLSLMLHSIRPYITPRGVLNTRPPNFRHGYQQDSFEYLGFLLDQLYEEEKKHILSLESSGNDDDVIADDDLNKETAMEVDTPTDDSEPIDSNEDIVDVDVDTSKVPIKTSPPPIMNTLIQKTFTGKVAVTYKCLNCSSESHNIDNFYDLQLSFPSQPDEMETPEYTTQTLLDGYFSTEKLVEDDKYFCNKCNMLCDGERDLSIVDGPSNLILVIKHFKYDRKFHIRRKIMHKVHHSETVGLRTTNEKGESLTLFYRLYAAIVHCGVNIDSGHYYTIGTDASGNWFKFNDSYISRSSLSELKNLNNLNTPYILFYELTSTIKNNDTASNPTLIGIDRDIYENGFTHQSNGPSTNGTMSTTDGTIANGSQKDNRHSVLLNLDNLPKMLRDYVLAHNGAYHNEIKRANDRSDGDLVRNSFNGNKKSDSDQDPPSSCGQGRNVIVNRYLC